jgi:hypothetical protein
VMRHHEEVGVESGGKDNPTQEVPIASLSRLSGKTV